jgi:hypothetical protein
MKQAARKKRKVFRTLIRIIHVGDKLRWDDSHVSAAREKMKSSQGSHPSFSAGKHENT